MTMNLFIKPALAGIVLGGIMMAGPAVASASDAQLESLCAGYRAPLDNEPASQTLSELAHPTGLLWRIEADDTPASHIFGTLHSQDSRVTRLPPPVRLALAQSRHLLIETIPDAGAGEEFHRAMFHDNGKPLSDLLPQPLFDRFIAIARDYMKPGMPLDQMQPWAAFGLIGRPRPINAPVLDGVIYQLALDQGQRVTGIETMRELIEALDRLDTADQIEILTDTICNHERIVANSKNLVFRYIERDLAGLVALNRGARHDPAVFDRLMESILYGRNERILQRVLPHLQEGRVFIAVGALHLPEPRGLLQQLQAAGYSVTPVY